MTLYEIKQEYLNMLNNLEVDENGEILNFEELESLESSLDEKLENVALYIKDLNANIKALSDEIDNLKARKDAYSNKAEKLKDYLSISMQEVGKTVFENAKCKLSFRKSVKVNVLDESKLPEEYLTIKTSITPNKTAIKEAINEGKEVEGAELLECQNLQIK